MLRKIKKITENKKFNFILNVLLLILLIMILFINQNNESKDVRKITREQNENYILTNPILDCEDVYQKENPTLSYSDLRRKISEIKETYNIQEISVYYRDLNNGPWVGIEEEEKFSPASLLKIPVAMAFLKYVEDNPEILNKKVYVEKEDILTNYKQNLKFDGLLELNKEYTLLEVWNQC
jgi:beta-lactamase class A